MTTRRYVDVQTGATWRREEEALATYGTRPEDNKRRSPALTREEALTAREFHAGDCAIDYGKTGKAKPHLTMEVWRRNGQTQTWKTRPTDFRVPVKHGMYAYGEITQEDLGPYQQHWTAPLHTSENCTALKEAAAWWDAWTVEQQHKDGAR